MKETEEEYTEMLGKEDVDGNEDRGSDVLKGL